MHRLALVFFLLVQVECVCRDGKININGERTSNITSATHTTHLARAQSPIPNRCIFLLLAQSVFEVFDLLSVALEQCVCIDDFFLRCMEL